MASFNSHHNYPLIGEGQRGLQSEQWTRQRHQNRDENDFPTGHQWYGHHLQDAYRAQEASAFAAQYNTSQHYGTQEYGFRPGSQSNVLHVNENRSNTHHQAPPYTTGQNSIHPHGASQSLPFGAQRPTSMNWTASSLSPLREGLQALQFDQGQRLDVDAIVESSTYPATSHFIADILGRCHKRCKPVWFNLTDELDRLRDSEGTYDWSRHGYTLADICGMTACSLASVKTDIKKELDEVDKYPRWIHLDLVHKVEWETGQRYNRRDLIELAHRLGLSEENSGYYEKPSQSGVVNTMRHNGSLHFHQDRGLDLLTAEMSPPEAIPPGQLSSETRFDLSCNFRGHQTPPERHTTLQLEGLPNTGLTAPAVNWEHDEGK